MKDERPREPVERAIRVFVSSTFRDMGKDRNHLVKQVFPLLREMCEERAVAWSEIDLRWGLTDEEVAEGKVLPICLEEIKRCLPARPGGPARRSPLPYFIGLLGERYGWVPHQIPEELCEREPWLLAQEGVSVTELEILHGVLRNPKMAGHALFYLRDPAYVSSGAVSEKELPHFLEQPSQTEIDEHGTEEAERRARERRRKLEDLKQRVRASDFPTQDYDDPEDLGRKVFDDLSAVIDRLFPADETVDPLDAESQRHESFAKVRSSHYVPRPAYFDKLDEFADHGDDDDVLAVVGESGRGKSALLAAWAIRYRSEHPKEVLMHFIGSSQKSADLTSLLARLNHELGRLLGIEDSDQADEVGGEVPDLKLIFAERLHRAGDRGRVVVVLDALNQLDDRDGAQGLAWLPPRIPPGVRLIVSALPGRAQDELKRRGWLEGSLKVRTLEYNERKELIDRYLASHTKHLSNRRREDLANLEQGGNALHLRTMLDDLRVWGDHESLDARIEELMSALTIDDLFELILARHEEDYNRPGREKLVSDAMTLIWASRQGLEESALLDMLGEDGEKLPPAYWSPLRIAASEMLIDRAGLIDFAHDFFRRAVEARYLDSPKAREAAHRRIASYMRSRGPTPRALEEVPWQLAEIEDWSELQALLTSRDWLPALWANSPFEVKKLWVRMEASSDLRPAPSYKEAAGGALEDDPDFALAAAELLHDLGANAEAEDLLQALRELAKRREDALLSREVLGILASVLSLRGRSRDAMELLRELEDICRGLEDEDGVARALCKQAHIHYSDQNFDRALELYNADERISRATGNRAGLERALSNLGRIKWRLGKPEEGLSLLLEAQAMAEEMGDPIGVAVSVSNQAFVYRDRDEIDRALELLAESGRIFRELGDQDRIQVNLGAERGIRLAAGDYERAMELAVEQERICRAIDSRDGLQDAIGDQAFIEQQRGNQERALELYSEEERICRDSENTAGLQWTLGRLASAWEERGDLGKAYELLREQEQLCRELGDTGNLQASLAQQAMIRKADGNEDQALKLLVRHEQISLDRDDLDTLRWSREQQAEILAGRADFDGAMNRYVELGTLCREKGDLAGLAWSLSKEAELYLSEAAEEHRDAERALALQREREQVCRELGDPDALISALFDQGHMILFEQNELGSAEDSDRALKLFEENERSCRELGGREASLAGNLGMLGFIRMIEQDRGEGERNFEEALALARGTENEELIEGLEKLHRISVEHAPSPD